jgi:hypothetical protein
MDYIQLGYFLNHTRTLYLKGIFYTSLRQLCDLSIVLSHEIIIYVATMNCMNKKSVQQKECSNILRHDLNAIKLKQFNVKRNGKEFLVSLLLKPSSLDGTYVRAPSFESTGFVQEILSKVRRSGLETGMYSLEYDIPFFETVIGSDLKKVDGVTCIEVVANCEKALSLIGELLGDEVIRHKNSGEPC